MSRFSKLSIVLAAIVAVFVSLIGLTAMNVAEAGGGSSNFRFEVTPPNQPFIQPQGGGGGGPDALVFLRSNDGEQIVRVDIRTNGSAMRHPPVTVDQNGTTFAVDGNAFVGNGVAYPGDKNPFVMTKWWRKSPPPGCEVLPRMVVSVTNPRTDSAQAKAVVDNRNGTGKLFVSANSGKTWLDLPVGDFYATDSTKKGNLVVGPDGNSSRIKVYASIGWNVRPAPKS